MATVIHNATGASMLIRAQLSLEQYAVFEWCSKTMGMGKLDDKDTIIKLLELKMQDFRQAHPTGFPIANVPQKPKALLTPEESKRLAWLEKQDFRSLSNDDIDELNILSIKKRGGL